MLRSCPRCGKIHEKGKCDITRKRNPGTRTPEQAFRSSSRWQRCAEYVRERDRNLCAACIHEQPSRYNDSNLSVHHVIPLVEDMGKRLDENNCITLCHDHHMMAEQGMIDRSTLFDWIDEANRRDGGDASRAGRLMG